MKFAWSAPVDWAAYTMSWPICSYSRRLVARSSWESWRSSRSGNRAESTRVGTSRCSMLFAAAAASVYMLVPVETASAVLSLPDWRSASWVATFWYAATWVPPGSGCATAWRYWTTGATYSWTLACLSWAVAWTEDLWWFDRWMSHSDSRIATTPTATTPRAVHRTHRR